MAISAAKPGDNGDSGESKAELTERQRRILAYIRESVDARGYPPSVREIGEAVGLASASSVAYQLGVLQRKGFLRKAPNRPRAVDIRPQNATAAAEESLARPVPAFVPVLGEIAAGTPILAEQNAEEVFPLPRELVGEGSHFLLRVKGDSMINAAIQDGDWVVVRQQDDATSGDIVAALLDDEATVKTFRRRGEVVELVPQNPAYDPIPANHASVLGRVVAVLRRI
ncbi:LexA repressor [Actinorhabdospora filicis]|uniref:LexA repressor n=1 Tax=Actinorhabdospora filicis TaxID=1785913 RepID=A0A9W6SNC8_9ACTN|nr:LexA repressor [Actinorhabdospora filicis]